VAPSRDCSWTRAVFIAWALCRQIVDGWPEWRWWGRDELDALLVAVLGVVQTTNDAPHALLRTSLPQIVSRRGEQTPAMTASRTTATSEWWAETGPVTRPLNALLQANAPASLPKLHKRSSFVAEGYG